MTRIISFELVVVLDELDDVKRQELADQIDTNPADLGEAADVDEYTLGEMIAGWIQMSDDEFWAGSDFYAKFARVSCDQTQPVRPEPVEGLSSPAEAQNEILALGQFLNDGIAALNAEQNPSVHSLFEVVDHAGAPYIVTIEHGR